MVFSGVFRGNPFCCFIQLLENRSWVVERVCLLRPECSLGNTLLSFALFHLYSKAKLACYSRYLLTSYLCILAPYDEKDIFFFLVLDLEGLGGPHRTIQIQLLLCLWLGYRLRLLWYWMVYLGNWLITFCHFEIAPKYFILDSFGHFWLWGLLDFLLWDASPQ